MPTLHTVTPGECLSSIAARHGFADWRIVYDHPDNAALRQLRPNPNVLLPGDAVVIPDKRQRSEACATDRVHRFVAARPRCRLRIRICHASGRPYADTCYRLTVDGRAIEARTDADGLVDQPVPPQARRAELLLWAAEQPGATLRFALALGELDPADTPSGAQARLCNLGWQADGLAAFQQAHGLPATGMLDIATADALRRRHDQ